MADRPLGPVIHVINGEAVCQPHQAFIAKGAKVVDTKNKVIGKLGDPIGPVHKPYQVVKLFDQDKNFDGEFLVAKVSGKKRNKKKSRNKKKFKN